MIGAFMAVLNIQITNASLLDIEGGIGTGVDNGAWISTAYLIGEIVVIPLTGYFEPGLLVPPLYAHQHHRLRRCSRSPAPLRTNLGTMIVLRGAAGLRRRRADPDGLHDGRHTPAERPAADGLAMFALSVTFAPAIGPTIGGYLTENLRLADDLLHQHRAQHHHGRSPSGSRWSASPCDCHS